MGETTKIEWTDASWNPVRAHRIGTDKLGWHCERVSDGCRNCYAESINRRLGTQLDFKPGHRADVEILLDDRMKLAPLHWKRGRRIFVGSMTDIFADFVPDPMLDQIFVVMALCPQHTFQVLTKRPERMRAYLTQLETLKRINGMVWSTLGTPSDVKIKHAGNWRVKLPLPNLWLGTSCEDQATADARIPDLLATPAAIRFVSAEPLLGPVDFSPFIWPVRDWWTAPYKSYAEAKASGAKCGRCRQALVSANRVFLDQIIAGGESGPNARPMHPDWARSLRDQCAVGGTAFFFKQNGEFLTTEITPNGTLNPTVPLSFSPQILRWHGDTVMRVHPKEGYATALAPGFVSFRVGKKRAGRLLDGRTHDEMPAGGA